jgi:hypothetical protein
MVLIGLLGKKRSGKDTVADHLVLNKDFIKKSFADPLKDVIKILFGFNEEQLYGHLKEAIDDNWNVTPRETMQFIGTDIVRNQFHKLIPDIGNDFWLKHFELWYQNNKHQNIVIADVRFQNEVDLILSLGGTIIKLERNDSNLHLNIDDHISEIEIDNIVNHSTIINNNGTINDLYNKINNLLNL